MKQQDKTNVMRVLDQKKIPYRSYYYEADGHTTGAEVASRLGQDPERVLKTLVTVAKSGQHYVFVIPVEAELDLKKAAAAVSEKAVSMIPQKELLPLTGYVHGGCSPIGMKKPFPTVLDSSAEAFETICFSAGRIGAQVEAAPKDLQKIIKVRFADVTTA